MRAKITDSLLKRAKPKDTKYDIRDTSLVGYVVRVMPSGSKTFYANPDRRTWVRIGTYPTLTEARGRNESRDILAKRSRGEDIKNPPIITLKRFREDHYKPEYESTHRSTKHLDNLVAFSQFDSSNLEQITPERLRRWRDQRLKDVKPATVVRNLKALGTLFGYAIKLGYAKDNPVAAVEAPKIDDVARTRFMSEAEEMRLRKALSGKRIEDVVLFLMSTGLRWSELTGLTWDDVEDERIWVISGKTGRRRWVPLNAEAKRILKNCHSTDGYVFPSSRTGVRMGDIRKSWATVCKKAKVTDLQLRDLRTHFGSKLVGRGADIYTVSKLLGHSSVALTERHYPHLAAQHLSDAVGLIE